MFEYFLVGLALLVLVGLPRAFSRRKGRDAQAYDDSWRSDSSAVSWSSADAPSSSHEGGSCDVGGSGDSASTGGDCGSDSGGSSSD